METADKEIVINASRALRDAPIFKLKVDNPPASLWQKLKARFNRHQPTLEFTVHGTRVDSMLLISEIVERIPKEELSTLLSENQHVLLTSFLPLFKAHINSLVEVIAIAIRNDGKPADKALCTLIKREFDNATILQTYQLVSAQMQLKDFLDSIVLACGLRILPETSRED